MDVEDSQGTTEGKADDVGAQVEPEGAKQPKKAPKRKKVEDKKSEEEEQATPQTNRKLDMDAAASEPKHPAPKKNAKTKLMFFAQAPPKSLVVETQLVDETSEASTVPATLDQLAALGRGQLKIVSTPSVDLPLLNNKFRTCHCNKP